MKRTARTSGLQCSAEAHGHLEPGTQLGEEEDGVAGWGDLERLASGMPADQQGLLPAGLLPVGALRARTTAAVAAAGPMLASTGAWMAR